MPFEALSIAHREALIDFLTATFQLPRSAPFVDPALLAWKYDEPRPDWLGPRSYAWMDKGEIAAHACLCPVTYACGGRQVAASYLIDWAAGRRSPGAGVLLLRKLASFFPVLLAIGGSRDTQEILPKLGYRVGGQLEYFVRVLRPWRQFRTDPFRRGWKAPLRLARNTFWSLQSLPAIPSGWACSPVAAFDSTHESLVQAPTPFCSTQRTPALMNYWLRCPGARMTAFLVTDHGNPCGWFLLAHIAGIVRIADLRMNSSAAGAWQAAYTLAVRTTLSDPEACELVAAASTPLAAEALRHNGFIPRRSDPIFLLDPQHLLPSVDIALMDSDAAYLYSPEYPYLS